MSSKGGSKTSEVEIPDWVKNPSIDNLARASDMQQIGYKPYFGPDVAAITPAQEASFNANIGAGEAFGLLQPGTLTASSGMPDKQTFAGGVQGYSSAPGYEQALAEYKAQNPDQSAQYDALFGNKEVV